MTDPATPRYAKAVAHLFAPLVGSTITIVTDGPSPDGPVPRPVKGVCFVLGRIDEAPPELWNGRNGAVLRLHGAWMGKRIEFWIATHAPVAVVRGGSVATIEYADKAHMVTFPRARNWQSALDALRRATSAVGLLSTIPQDLVRVTPPTDLAELDPTAPQWFALPVGTKLTDSLPSAIGTAYASKAEASAAAFAARAARVNSHGAAPGTCFVQCRSAFDPVTGVEHWEPREAAEKPATTETPAAPSAKPPKEKKPRAKKSDAAGAQ